MRKTILLIFVAMLALTWSCQKDAGENNIQDDANALKSGNYVIGFEYEETTLTFVINQSGAQDISHMLFQFIDCYGEYLTIDNLVSATVNGEDWPVVATTGEGTGCEFDDGPFIKLDDFDDLGDVVTVVIVLDEKVANVDYLIKAGQGCFPFSGVTDICDQDNQPPTCYEWQTETAWAANSDEAGSIRYVTRGNWATYLTFEGETKTVSLFAGQTTYVGEVTLTPVVDGVEIAISLDGWELAIYDYDEFGNIIEDTFDGQTVKIQGYSSTPPARNPAPGQFNTYKGNELTVTVPAFDFYGIHLDVGLLTQLEECPPVE